MNLVISFIVYLTVFLGIFSLVFFILSFFGRSEKKFASIGQPRVSILVPAFNEEKGLKKSVESLLTLDYPQDKIEILIIDDGSTDMTPKIGRMLSKKHKNVSYFRKENGGKGSALNLGIEKASTDYIVTFDADSIANKDVLKLMVPHFANPRVAAVTNAMKVYKPRTIVQRIQAIEYDLGIFLRKAIGNMNAINVTPGPFSIIRKSFFKKHGGYRTDILTEDMEMAMRIQSYNYIIENEARAIVYTVSPKNFVSLLRQRRRWYVGTMDVWMTYRQLFSKRFGEFGLFVLPLAVLSVFTTMIITFYFGVRALIDGYHSFLLYSKIGYDFLHNLNFQISEILIKVYNSLLEGYFIFMVLFLVVTLILLAVMNKKIGARENGIRTFINYAAYSLIYSILRTFWWSVAIIYRIFGGKVKW